MSTKLLALLQSRKFWALILGLTAITIAVINGQMPPAEAIQAAIAALAAYMIGTGLENGTAPIDPPAAAKPINTIRYEKL